MTERAHDPWGDVPWSDTDPGGSSPAPGGDVPAIPAASPLDSGASAAEAAASAGPVTCAWCGTVPAEGAKTCGSCGAALAQREQIGDLVIPGLTAVDPVLQDYDARPLHLRGPSPTQGAASGLVVAAIAGGPLGLALAGGVGALAAAEYLAAGRDKPGEKGHDGVGEASGAVLQAIERLERGEALPAATETTPRPELDRARAQSPDHGAATEEATDGAG